MRTHILLLCTGNLCRSPMAEGPMRALLPSHELFSAALCALDGAPADPLAVALMREALAPGAAPSAAPCAVPGAAFAGFALTS